MSVNQRFDDLLKLTKTSQAEFCEVTGYDAGKVSHIINGRTKYPKTDFFQGIAQHFKGWNLVWLLIGEGEPLIEESKLENRNVLDIDRSKLHKVIAEQQVDIMEKKEKLTEVFDLLMKAAGKLEDVLPEEVWRPWRAELERELSELVKG